MHKTKRIESAEHNLHVRILRQVHHWMQDDTYNPQFLYIANDLADDEKAMGEAISKAVVTFLRECVWDLTIPEESRNTLDVQYAAPFISDIVADCVACHDTEDKSKKLRIALQWFWGKTPDNYKPYKDFITSLRSDACKEHCRKQFSHTLQQIYLAIPRDDDIAHVLKLYYPIEPQLSIADYMQNEIKSHLTTHFRNTFSAHFLPQSKKVETTAALEDEEEWGGSEDKEMGTERASDGEERAWIEDKEMGTERASDEEYPAEGGISHTPKESKYVFEIFKNNAVWNRPIAYMPAFTSVLNQICKNTFMHGSGIEPIEEEITYATFIESRTLSEWHKYCLSGKLRNYTSTQQAILPSTIDNWKRAFVRSFRSVWRVQAEQCIRKTYSMRLVDVQFALKKKIFEAKERDWNAKKKNVKNATYSNSEGSRLRRQLRTLEKAWDEQKDPQQLDEVFDEDLLQLMREKPRKPTIDNETPSPTLAQLLASDFFSKIKDKKTSIDTVVRYMTQFAMVAFDDVMNTIDMDLQKRALDYRTKAQAKSIFNTNNTLPSEYKEYAGLRLLQSINATNRETGNGFNMFTDCIRMLDMEALSNLAIQCGYIENISIPHKDAQWPIPLTYTQAESIFNIFSKKQMFTPFVRNLIPISKDAGRIIQTSGKTPRKTDVKDGNEEKRRRLERSPPAGQVNPPTSINPTEQVNPPTSINTTEQVTTNTRRKSAGKAKTTTSPNPTEQVNSHGAQQAPDIQMDQDPPAPEAMDVDSDDSTPADDKKITDETTQARVQILKKSFDLFTIQLEHSTMMNKDTAFERYRTLYDKMQQIMNKIQQQQESKILSVHSSKTMMRICHIFMGLWRSYGGKSGYLRNGGVALYDAVCGPRGLRPKTANQWIPFSKIDDCILNELIYCPQGECEDASARLCYLTDMLEVNYSIRHNRNRITGRRINDDDDDDDDDKPLLVTIKFRTLEEYFKYLDGILEITEGEYDVQLNSEKTFVWSEYVNIQEHIQEQRKVLGVREIGRSEIVVDDVKFHFEQFPPLLSDTHLGDTDYTLSVYSLDDDHEYVDKNIRAAGKERVPQQHITDFNVKFKHNIEHDENYFEIDPDHLDAYVDAKQNREDEEDEEGISRDGSDDYNELPSGSEVEDDEDDEDDDSHISGEEEEEEEEEED